MKLGKYANRVEHCDDERNLGNGIIIMLKGGWNFDGEHGLHVFGEDTPRELMASLRGRTFKCDCDVCK